MSEPGVFTKFPDRADGAQVAHVIVDNSARLNCLPTTQVVKLRQAFDELAHHDDIRAVILTGAGERAFIGGADLNELGGLCADSGRLYITRLHQACAAIRSCPVPVIGRVNGFCLGAGLEVAASCDMRAAAESAVFGMPEVHMGLPSVIEAALLPGQIGWGKTREILLTGETFSAADALAMGFVQKVAPLENLDDAIEDWIAAICRAAPGAIRTQKALIDRWQRVSVEEGVMAGIDALSDSYVLGEPQKRIAAFFAAKAKGRDETGG